MVGIHKLLECERRIVDDGNTDIVIEHNLDIIGSADHVMDIGPEGGHEGGTVLFQGSVDDLIASDKSYTGKYLKPYYEWVREESKC